LIAIEAFAIIEYDRRVFFQRLSRPLLSENCPEGDMCDKY
jgi:hypothetical protein